MARFVLAVIACAFLVGCATTGVEKKTTEVYRPVFDWNPPADYVPTASGVTFGIVGGTYADDEDWITAWPFDTFAANMKDDFNELMTGRGFTTTGPFDTMDEMTYPDKKNCDLVLEPSLDVKLNLSSVTVEQHTVFLGEPYYTVNGTAEILGRVTFSALESLSGTRMWNKNVVIEPVSFPFKGETRYPTQPTQWYLKNEPGLQNAIAPHLEKAYIDILDKAWLYLDPEEMTVVKNQAMEVKDKTTFSGNK